MERRLEFSAVGEPYWGDRPVAIVGAGPSLHQFEFSRLRGPWRVIAVNQKVWDLPWADACISIDIPWIRDQAARVVATMTMPVYVAGPEYHQCPHVPGMNYLKRSRTFGFSDAADTVEMGGTSGYAALNFAYLKRAKFVVLFGFDYSAARGDHDKPEQYPWHPVGHNARYWPRWATNFAEALPQIERAGMKVLNASPESTISAFGRCTIEQGLAALRNIGESHGLDPHPEPQAHAQCEPAQASPR
jgi:hypothetical protein